jgi:hypothetical protein
MPYGYDEEIAAQTMLRTYRPLNVGDLGSPSYLGDYLGAEGATSPWDFITQAATTTAQIASTSQAGASAKPAACRKPAGFMLWKRARKDAWTQQCNAAMAAQSSAASYEVSAPAPQQASPTWLYALGGLAAIAVVGGIVYTVTKD